jgi:hypothetical protein
MQPTAHTDIQHPQVLQLRAMSSLYNTTVEERKAMKPSYKGTELQ